MRGEWENKMLRYERNEYKNRVQCWPEDDCFFRYGVQGGGNVLTLNFTTTLDNIMYCALRHGARIPPHIKLLAWLNNRRPAPGSALG
jgi:hypothetical protein